MYIYKLINRFSKLRSLNENSVVNNDPVHIPTFGLLNSISQDLYPIAASGSSEAAIFLPEVSSSNPSTSQVFGKSSSICRSEFNKSSSTWIQGSSSACIQDSSSACIEDSSSACIQDSSSACIQGSNFTCIQEYNHSSGIFSSNAYLLRSTGLLELFAFIYFYFLPLFTLTFEQYVLMWQMRGPRTGLKWKRIDRNPTGNKNKILNEN